MKIPIEEVLEITDTEDRYIFYKNVPIDAKRPKYDIWRKFYIENSFYCRCCKSSPAYFKLIKCSGDGAIFTPTGDVKHTFKLFDENGNPMTFDHWIPKKILKEIGIDSNNRKNLVLMCTHCNKLKGDLLPHNWWKIFPELHN